MSLFERLRAVVASSHDWNRPRVAWPVRQGNGVVVMNFDQELASKAKIGDTIEVSIDFKVVGCVRKIADDGWLQWQFEGAA